MSSGFSNFIVASKLVFFFFQMGKGEFLLIHVALIAILQLSPMGFELNILRLQGYALTTELSPHVSAMTLVISSLTLFCSSI